MGESCDWLDWMGLAAAGTTARLDRYIGYYEPHFNSHEALDRDTAVRQEVRNVAAAVATAVDALRAGRLAQPDADIVPARKKRIRETLPARDDIPLAYR